ncbi:MAG: RNA-binding protein [Clostridiales bacterium]|nr:RNA-binding protein [Clostridiales bacterium]
MKELYIDRGITQSRAAVYINGIIEELYVENHEDESITGNIYKGRIENIVPGLNAAFVNIGTSKNAILHFKEDMAIDKYKRGKEILVQVIREASGDKGPRVSEEISIPGKYIVLLPNYNHVYISHKIRDVETINRLENISKDIWGSGYGIIFRTEAESIEDDKILEEYSYLKNLWNIVLKKYDFIKPPEMVFNSRNFLNYIVREFIKSDIDRICINRKQDLEYIADVLNKPSKEVFKLIEYNEQDFRFVNTLSNDMLKILDKKVLLPSGSYLFIESTEALTTIDINTGSFIGDKDKEETVLKTNQEASIEIFRMVKLLNISGIIIIDYINMKNNKNKQIINDFIRQQFKKDRVHNSVYDFTHLGLLEMSRAKRGRPLNKLIYENKSCREYNISYMLKEIENKCLRYSKHYNRLEFTVYTDSNLYENIMTANSGFVSDMESIYGIKIDFIKSSSVKTYIIDRDMKAEAICIYIGDKKIVGELTAYSEDKNGNVNITINKH